MTRIRLGRGCLLALVLLGGCADMFIGDPPTAAGRWQGVTTAGPGDVAGCGPLAIDVAIYDDPLYGNRRVDGRAEPTSAATGTLARAADVATSWWIHGYANRADLVQFETARQRPVYFRAKPYAVWRGKVEGDRATLVESGSPCRRQLVLNRS